MVVRATPPWPLQLAHLGATPSRAPWGAARSSSATLALGHSGCGCLPWDALERLSLRAHNAGRIGFFRYDGDGRDLVRNIALAGYSRGLAGASAILAAFLLLTDIAT